MRWFKRNFRRFAIFTGAAPARVEVLRDDGVRFHFVVHAHWWTTREDVYAAVAEARANGILPAGRLCHDERLNSLE